MTAAPSDGRELRFGVSLPPRAAVDLRSHLGLVEGAEAGGLELVGIMDHPYLPRDHDTLSLLAFLLARTERLRFFPDVAALPLRPPAMLAKAMASLDILSDGRVELGIGAGGCWDRIHSFGLDAAGTGPRPAHPIGIWIGAVGPRAFRLTGRLADGWAAPIPLVPSVRGLAGGRLRQLRVLAGACHRRADRAVRPASRSQHPPPCHRHNIGCDPCTRVEALLPYMPDRPVCWTRWMA